jgi:hypothetical protein
MTYELDSSKFTYELTSDPPTMAAERSQSSDIITVAVMAERGDFGGFV